MYKKIPPLGNVGIFSKDEPTFDLLKYNLAKSHEYVYSIL
jgi:hypothetical protein